MAISETNTARKPKKLGKTKNKNRVAKKKRSRQESVKAVKI